MDDRQIDAMLGHEGPLERAGRMIREFSGEPPSPMDLMTEPERRLHRMKIYREVLDQAHS